MNFKQDVCRTIEFIEGQEQELKFSKYSKIYPFTTECIDGYLKPSLPNHAKSALTVLSSSDQLFNLLLNGVENITTFDINLLTYYYFELKKAYIINNDYISFINLIKQSHFTRIPFLVFLVEKLDEIGISMNRDAYLFWKELKEAGCQFGYLQYSNHSFFSVKDDNSYIENEQKYNQLQSILKNGFSFSFYNCSIMQLDQLLCEEFDYMNFSNIYDYSHKFIYGKESEKVFYRYIKEKILPYLKEHGNAMIAYTYFTKNEFLENQDLRRISIYRKHATAYVLKKY